MLYQVTRAFHDPITGAEAVHLIKEGAEEEVFAIVAYHYLDNVARCDEDDQTWGMPEHVTMYDAYLAGYRITPVGV